MNAAVLAGARSLNVGQDVTSQAANAQLIATNTFNANVSGMSQNVTLNSSSFQVTQSSTSVRTVSGSVTASLPLMLMGLLRFTSTQITVTASAQRRNVNVMLVLDNSGPMNGAPLTVLQADAIAFLKMFSNNSNTDNVGLVVFGTDPYVADPPASDFQTNITNDINSMQAPASGLANTAAAIWAAYQQLQNLNQPGALNVIVLFTDGLPGGFTGNFAGLVTNAAYCSTTASPLNGVLWAFPNEAEKGRPCGPGLAVG